MSGPTTILVIEDDRTLTVALSDALTNSGFTSLTAHTGEEGLAVAKEKQPDLIILDLILGKLSGLDVLRQLRQEKGWGQKVPVVIMTSVAYLKNMDEVKELANKIIAKSDFEMTALIDTVKRLTNTQPANPPGASEENPPSNHEGPNDKETQP